MKKTIRAKAGVTKPKQLQISEFLKEPPENNKENIDNSQNKLKKRFQGLVREDDGELDEKKKMQFFMSVPNLMGADNWDKLTK